jgi:hypothetical protein
MNSIYVLGALFHKLTINKKTTVGNKKSLLAFFNKAADDSHLLFTLLKLLLESSCVLLKAIVLVTSIYPGILDCFLVQAGGSQCLLDSPEQETIHQSRKQQICQMFY